MALSGATILSQSGLHIPQSSRITGPSPSDCLVACPVYSLGALTPLQMCSRCILQPQLTRQERIIKLIQEGNLQWSVVKDVGCSQSAVFKIWFKYKSNEVLKKEKLVACKKCESTRIENLKQYALKIEKLNVHLLKKKFFVYYLLLVYLLLNKKCKWTSKCANFMSFYQG